MKSKKSISSLTLSKTTVANLNQKELDNAKGGTGDFTLVGCPGMSEAPCPFTYIVYPSYCIL